MLLAGDPIYVCLEKWLETPGNSGRKVSSGDSSGKAKASRANRFPRLFFFMIPPIACYKRESYGDGAVNSRLPKGASIVTSRA